MKILVVSLLRLGDLIQQKPLLIALRDKYPNAEVHLLVNKQFANFQELIEGEVAKIHTFNRDLLQRSMGESSFNLFSCFDLLEDTIAEINSEKFDLVMNWTHNRLSAYLLGTFEIAEKVGLFFADGRLQGLNSSPNSAWLRYFNDNISGNSKSHFHYVELLGKAFALPVAKYPHRLQHNTSQQIYLQCLTSDSKKNWPLGRFKSLKDELALKYPQWQIQVLCSAAEQLPLQKYFAVADLKACNLVEARELLRKARLLISGDTSIKHLAAQVGTPVLEISLGGSDANKTAAFAENLLVVAGKAACYPCVHSKECSQKSHLCAESVSVHEVVAAAVQLLEGHEASAAKDISAEIGIERAIWQSYLDQTDIAEVMPLSLAESLSHRTEILDGYQKSFESCENFNEIFTTLQVIREKNLDTGSYFQKLSQVFNDRFGNAESAFQALKKALDQSGALIQIRKKLIEKTLSSDVLPVGGTHAERT